MADLEKTVSIVFKGVDDLSGKLKSISKSVDTFAGDIQSATQPLADLATNVLKIETALTGLAAGGLAYAVKEAGAFEASFNEISTLIDGTAEDFDKFKEAILDYATKSTASIEDVNAAVYSAISAGVAYGDALDVLTEAEKLSTAGKAELEPTIKALVSTLNAYGESTDQAGKYADVFFKTVKLGQTTLPELSTSLSQVTSIANTAGVPFETIAAAIADLTAKGAPTSDAITRIKSALVAIIKPSESATQAARDLGIDFSVSAVKSKGFETVLKEVYAATGGSAEQMVKLFGRVEGLNAALVLGADAGGTFSSKLNEMRNSAGATDEAFKKMSDNTSLIFQTLVNNLRAVLIELGTPMLDETKDIAEGITDIFKGIRIGIDAGSFDSILNAVEAFGAKVAEDLKKIAEIMPEALEKVDFDGLVKAFEGLGGAVGEAFKALFGDVDLTTADGLSKAIQKVVDAVTALTNISTGIIEAWRPFIAWLSEAIEKFTDADAKTHSWLGNILGLAQAVNATSGLLGGFATGIGAVGSALTSIAALKFLGIGALTSALWPLALGGAIGAGLAYVIGKVSDLTTKTEKVPREIEMEIKLDNGNVLNLIDGIVRDAEGKIISVPYRFEEKEPPKSSSALFQELINEGRSDAVINYVMSEGKDSTKALEAALKEAGVLVTKKVDQVVTDGITKVEEKIKEVKPIDLVDKEQLERDLAEIKARAEVVQTAMEWQAKIDIAEVQAAAKVLEAAFSATSKAVEATAAAGASMASSLAGLDFDKNWEAFRTIEDALDKQMDMQQQAHDRAKALTDVQIELTKAKLDALKKGKSLIEIDGAGLQPHLEAFMWAVLEAIQVRASQEGAEFLLGIT